MTGRTGTEQAGLLASQLQSPREAVRAAQREQLLRAMLETVADAGFAATTITAVVKRARVSTRTFYELFADKSECFIAAYELATSYVDGRIAAAVDDAGDAETFAIAEAALHAYLETLAAEPDLARVLLVEVLGAGRAAWERRDQALEARVDLLRHAIDRDAVLALFGAAEELARARLRSGAPAELPSLARRLARALAGGA
jgi:AcrR family transcriptional regulator